MLRDPAELAEGDTAYLYPQTRQASTNCHRMLRVKIIKPPKTHWPMVVVSWSQDGTDLWELVHKDNIRKHPASTMSASAEKKDGDTVGDGGGGMAKWKPKVMPGKKKAEPTEGQETLW